jgi:hypothetical protein
VCAFLGGGRGGVDGCRCICVAGVGWKRFVGGGAQEARGAIDSQPNPQTCTSYLADSGVSVHMPLHGGWGGGGCTAASPRWLWCQPAAGFAAFQGPFQDARGGGGCQNCVDRNICHDHKQIKQQV